MTSTSGHTFAYYINVNWPFYNTGDDLYDDTLPVDLKNTDLQAFWWEDCNCLKVAKQRQDFTGSINFFGGAPKSFVLDDMKISAQRGD